MSNRGRILTVILLAGTLLALALLAAGVARLPLEPGRLFDQQAQQELAGLLAQSSVLRGLFLLLLLALILLVLVSFLLPRRRVGSPERGRDNILAAILRLILAVIAFFVIRRQIAEGKFKFNPPQFDPESVTFPEAAPGASPAPGGPQWLAFLLSFGIVLLLAGLAWIAWKRMQRKPTSLHLLANEAQAALQDLHGGADLSEVILRCYAHMCRAVSQQRGVERKESMTPREFERRLDELGLPAGAVAQLTRLFETARYSSHPASEQEKQQAVDSLSAILQACERTRSEPVGNTSPGGSV